jgi:hypothetical protein
MAAGTQARSAAQHETDWGPITGPLAGGCVAVLCALAGKHHLMPWWIPGLFAAVFAAGAVLVGWRRRTVYRNIAYRVACWTGGGLWAMAAIGLHWFRGWWILALGCAAVIAAFASLVFGPHEERLQPEEPTEEDLAGARAVFTPEELYWRRLIIARLGKEEAPPETVKMIQGWDGGTGLTLYVEWAEGSVRGWEDLRDMQLDLARAARLPPGCPITAAPALYANVPPELGLRVHQGAGILRIAKVNQAGLIVDFPDDYSPISVKDPFAVGFHPDGRPTLIEVYQAAGLVVGRRNAGKTVLLHDVTANVHRMRDCIVIHVDLNGGKLIGPWLTPYAMGLVDRPTVELAAVTPRQALKLSRILLKIAKDRNIRYQPLMIAENIDIIPASEDLPEILVIIDEGMLITGENASKEAKKAAENFKELQSIGRAVLVNVLFSVQRGTSDFIPSALKKGTALGICGKVKDNAELASVFDWGRGVKVEDLLYKGQFFIQRDDDEDSGNAVEIFKSYRLMPRQIGEIVQATAYLRPAPDDAALAIGGETWRTWWQHPWMRWYMAQLRNEDPGPEPEDMPLDDEDLAAGTAAGDDLVGQADDLLAQANQMLDAAKQEREKPTHTAAPAQPAQPAPVQKPTLKPEPDLPDWVRDELAALDALPTVDEPVRPGADGEPGGDGAVTWSPAVQAVIREVRKQRPEAQAERRTAMLRILAAAGEDGMRTAALVLAVQRGGMPVVRGTVWEWLRAERDEGRVEQVRQGVWRMKGQAA